MPHARQRIHLPPASVRLAMAALVRGDLWEGEDIARFERGFAAFIGARHAVAVASGRAGLRFIFDALALEPGSEVICSAYAYPIVPHVVKLLGYQVKFADCELRTLGMDPEALAKAISPRTRAVVATHLFGVPCRIREIASLAAARGVALVEDCAHIYGATAGGKKVGSFGKAAYFSFETSKVINTMGGGMLTTSDDAMAARLREVSDAEPRKAGSWLAKRLMRTGFEATVTHPLVFNAAVYPALRLVPRKKGGEDRFASGYTGDGVTMEGRMGRYTNYQARLGLRQMAQIAPSLERRVANARRLIDRLRGMLTFQEPANADDTANFMLVTALVPELAETTGRLLRAGVDTKHHYMQDCSRIFPTGETFPNAERAEQEVLHLPAYPELSPEQVDRIADRIRRALP